jgi:hypothetical protein
MKEECEHFNFIADVKVARLEDTRQFNAEIAIKCADCGRDFQFLGLAPGLDLQGACCTVDALEARLAIVPQGTVPNPLDRMQLNIGFHGKHNA